jgi:hypothetical protein
VHLKRPWEGDKRQGTTSVVPQERPKRLPALAAAELQKAENKNRSG